MGFLGYFGILLDFQKDFIGFLGYFGIFKNISVDFWDNGDLIGFSEELNWIY